MFKKINRWYISAVIWFVLMFLFVFFIRDQFSIWKIDEYNVEGLTYSQVNLSENSVSQQLIIADPVQRINLLMVNGGEDAGCQVEIRNVETENVVWQETLQVSNSGGEEVVVALDLPEYNLQSGNYYLTFSSPTSDELSVCVADKSFDVNYMENDEVFQKHIRMQVVYGASYDLLLSGGIFIALLIVGWSIIYAIKINLPIERCL